MTRTGTSLRQLLAATLAALATAAAGLVATATPAAAATTPGIDVSHYQGAINWTSVRNAGIQFAFIKATEGTSYKDPRFNTNYVAAYNAGVIRGAYHFARPNISSGAVQANYLASNGGAWSADSRTLPAALDLEANPYAGGYCYGLSTTGMRNWVQDFLNTYRARTGRYAVIYTTTSWWNQCTGSWSAPWANHPLWVARWSSTVGALPAGAPFWSFWQYTDRGSVAGISGGVDRNHWNGDRSRLIALANNT
ncbi:GH25 family lysozyme [Micromonospora sp. DT46]|uniref:GH25 family lysozyme n=1 Tax=unclassified Micromonospora TaxID=2617518 RepID=UPI00124B9031|nr:MULTISPECIES: GH25 family lysozyme [unclassified Micromonospora]KAB1155446.1 hydrolase [Micromonospora sp. AMSO12t]WSG04266.1 GH25 family lysozyme [Micromonospora sp. NBC_01740]